MSASRDENETGINGVDVRPGMRRIMLTRLSEPHLRHRHFRDMGNTDDKKPPAPSATRRHSQRDDVRPQIANEFYTTLEQLSADPELLAALARDFREHGHDLRRLMKTIASSRTYQLSHRPNASNREDVTNYSRSLARGLDAEVLLDAVSDVTGVPEIFSTAITPLMRSSTPRATLKAA